MGHLGLTIFFYTIFNYKELSCANRSQELFILASVVLVGDHVSTFDETLILKYAYCILLFFVGLFFFIKNRVAGGGDFSLIYAITILLSSSQLLDDELIAEIIAFFFIVIIKLLAHRMR